MRAGNRVETAVVESLGRHRTRRAQRRIHIGRGKQRGRPEDVPDVTVTGYDPMVDRVTVKGGRGLPRFTHEGIRIGQKGFAQRIEVGAEGF